MPIESARSYLRILTLACEGASELSSAELDRPLCRTDRVALSIHLLLCGHCRRLRRQLALLRDAARLLGDAPESLPPLPPDDRNRIKAALEQTRRPGGAGDEG